jgi:hypothetical protein
MKRWLKLLLGWFLGASLLWWLLQRVDTSQLADSAAHIPAWLWLLCGLLWLFSFVFRGRRVQQEWQWRRPVSLAVAMRLVLLHNAAVLVLPFRAGEAGYPLLVKQSVRCTSGSILAQSDVVTYPRSGGLGFAVGMVMARIAWGMACDLHLLAVGFDSVALWLLAVAAQAPQCLGQTFAKNAAP